MGRFEKLSNELKAGGTVKPLPKTRFDRMREEVRSSEPSTAVTKPMRQTDTASRAPSGRAGEMYRGLAADREVRKLEEQARQARVDLDTETLNRVNKQLKDLRASQGKQTLGDRASDVLSAVFSGSAGSFTNAAGFAANLFQDPERDRRSIERAREALRTGRTSDGKPVTEAKRKTLQESISRHEQQTAKRESPDSAVNSLYRAADSMQRDSANFQGQAKKGLGSVGSTVVDAATSMGQSMLDAGIGLATGTGMTPFVVRSLGGATQEGRQKGADLDQQLLYGSAQAAKELVTEKLFGLAVPQKVLGKAGAGSLDGAIEKGIRNVTERLAKTETGQKALGGFLTWLGGGVTEGLEEGIGALIENTLIGPNLRAWDPDERTGQEKFEDGLYDMLVGGVSGLMGVSNLVGYRSNAGRAAGRAVNQTGRPLTAMEANGEGTDTAGEESGSRGPVDMAKELARFTISDPQMNRQEAAVERAVRSGAATPETPIPGRIEMQNRGNTAPIVNDIIRGAADGTSGQVDHGAIKKRMKRMEGNLFGPGGVVDRGGYVNTDTPSAPVTRIEAGNVDRVRSIMAASVNGGRASTPMEARRLVSELRPLARNLLRKESGVRPPFAEYTVDVDNRLLEDYLSMDDLSAEKLALLGDLPSVVRNSAITDSEVIGGRRVDSYAAPVMLEGRPYRVLFDVYVDGDGGKVRNVQLTTPRNAYARPAGADMARELDRFRLRETEAQGPTEQESAPETGAAESPVQVGRVTTIKYPYQGPKPVQAQKNAAPIQVDRSSVETAQNRIEGARKLAESPMSAGSGFKSILKRSLREVFHPAEGIEVEGVSFEGKPYRVDIGNKVLGKVLGDKNFSAEKVSLLGVLREIVQSGEYVGSSTYKKHSTKEKDTIRFDHFETPVTIDGKSYIAKFDVEAFPSENNFRTYHVVEIELSPAAHTDVGPVPTALAAETTPVEGTSSLNSDTTIPQGAESVKTGGENLAFVDPDAPSDDGVGAANAHFDTFGAAEERYGVLPEGEKPVRPDDVPRRTTDDSRVSLLARTLKGAAIVPDEFIPTLEKAVLDGKFSYIPHTNAQAAAQARQYIEYNGWNKAMMDFHNAVKERRAGDDITALGIELVNNAANSGDMATTLDLYMDLRAAATNAGQAAQAFRMIKQASPAHRLYMMQRSVKAMVDAMNLPEGSVQLDKDQLNAYLKAGTEAERDKIISEIQQNIADQLPSTLLDKWTALRYVNMLGNFRTQVRNLAGNTGMQGVRAVKDLLASGLETLYQQIDPKAERTKAAAVGKDWMKAAKEDYPNVEDLALGEGKYQEGLSDDSFARGVNEKRTIFKNNGTWGKDGGLLGLARSVTDQAWKAPEGYRRITNEAMTKGDVLFTRHTYARALAGYLKAHNVTAEQFADPAWKKANAALVDQARMYAVREAQEATFRDNNTISDWISKMGRRKDTPKAGRILLEGLAPFRKTPANVLVRAEEYSPLGIANTIYTAVQAQKGRAGSADVINSLSKTLTGTGLFAAGLMLFNGLIPGITIRGGDDEDEKQRSFDSLVGHQSYSIELPGGASYTLDWLSPGSMPFFMGVELAKLMEDGDFEWKDLESALTSIAEPMLQMSMLQGVNDTLDNIKYSENNLGQMAVTLALSYLTQGLTNSLAGQLERARDPLRQMTYADKNEPLPAWVQRQVGKASAKIPGWDYQQIPYIDEWGRTESSGPPIGRGAENLLSPGYFSRVTDDAVNRELQRLAEAAGDTGVYPDKVEKSFQLKDGSTKYLTAEEYTSYARNVGQTRREILEGLFANPGYQKLSDRDKAKVVQEAYSYATAAGKRGIAGSAYDPGKWVLNVMSSPLPLADAILYKRMLSIENEKTGSQSQANANVREAILRDDSLTVKQKNLLDDFTLNDGFYIPQDKDVDYSSEDSFIVSQMSESAIKHWDAVLEVLPEITGAEYETAWGIFNRKGTKEEPYTKDRKKRDLREALGLNNTEVNALYSAMKKEIE